MFPDMFEDPKQLGGANMCKPRNVSVSARKKLVRRSDEWETFQQIQTQKQAKFI